MIKLLKGEVGFTLLIKKNQGISNVKDELSCFISKDYMGFSPLTATGVLGFSITLIMLIIFSLS